jgi:hypothetical protein
MYAVSIARFRGLGTVTGRERGTKGVGMRGLKTNVEAMVGVVLASLALATPAAAGCGAGAIQEATYVDGVWDGLEGALVTTTPSPEGLAWRVAEGATLEVAVVIETFAEPESTIGSALKMVPAADRGVAPLFGDVDQRVMFTGSVPCDADPEVDVHEDPIEAFEQPEAAASPVPSDPRQAIAQQVAVAQRAPEPVALQTPTCRWPWNGLRPI